MKIIVEGIETQIEVDRSKFITQFYHVTDLNTAKSIQQQVKKQHPNANHVCMAMVVNDLHYSSDDGEPANTAGQPMLQTLIGNQVNEVLCLVIRYFGGTLLGRGGLIRAYGQAVSHGLSYQNYFTYQQVDIVKIEIPYDLMNIIETKTQPKATIIHRDYVNHMIFTLEVFDSTILDELIEMTNNNIKIEPIKSEQRLIPITEK